MQKEVVVLGAGESGVAAALLLKARGIPVFVSDRGLPSAYFLAELEQAGIPYEAGVVAVFLFGYKAATHGCSVL